MTGAILVVEDDEFFQTLMVAALEGAGYAVVVVDNGRHAMRVLASREIDLVVTDVVMPEMDGLELILAMRKEYSDIPVIAVSAGWHLTQDKIDFLPSAAAFGAVATLSKPFRPNDLVRVVADALA